MKSKAKGRLAEFIARVYFRFKGYKIISSNYITGKGCGAGEIDFIAIHKKVIVFVEVKQRSSIEKAKYAVSHQQQRRIWRAAEEYLSKHISYINYDVRFDVVLVCFPYKICHIQDAFRCW